MCNFNQTLYSTSLTSGILIADIENKHVIPASSYAQIMRFVVPLL